MIKNLFLVAGASFVLAVACFAGAAALGWQDHFWRDYGWRDYGWGERYWGPFRHWNINVGPDIRVRGDDGDAGGASADGATATRQIAWTGGDSFIVDTPADVTFTQAPGPGRLIVTGPRDVVEHAELSGSRLDLDDSFADGRLTVTMTAPNVRNFSIGGVGNLTINSFNQDELKVDVSGAGDVKASGRALHASIDISGDGDVDLSGLKLQRADADISGSGDAAIAPTDAANLQISGSGDVRLLTHPAKLTSNVSGSGRVVEDGAAGAAD
jgi:hypothetical protein